MTSVKLTVLCVCLCLQNVFCQYEETCTTLEGGIGTCMPTIYCAPYFDLQRESKSVTTSFQLRDGQCRSDGYNNMVCCPVPNELPDEPTKSTSNYDFYYDCGEDEEFRQIEETCTTIEGGVGKCESLISCEPYFHLTRQSKTLPLAFQLRDAQCGYDGEDQKVCCPISVPSTSSPTDEASFRTIPDSDYITAFPEPPECGVGKSFFIRVIGGINANLGDFPWMALLGVKRDDSVPTRWICGGSLISHRHVLTAAHCIKNELNVVRLGDLDFERNNDSATPIDFNIKRKIKHENFDYSSFTDDFGLLVLDKEVEFTKLIRPICLPKSDDPRFLGSLVGYTQFLAGWGNIDNRGTFSSHLRYVLMPVLNNSVCERAYESRVIDERIMCVGSIGKDSCSGDSGGPLMNYEKDPVNYSIYFYQTAVVSYGYTKCGEENYPGVYSSIKYFMPWLQKHVLGFVE